jgi:hypothetical protein
MENEVLLKSLKVYQKELYRQIEFHGQINNEEIKKMLLHEVWKVEEEIDRIKKS